MDPADQPTVPSDIVRTILYDLEHVPDLIQQLPSLLQGRQQIMMTLGNLHNANPHQALLLVMPILPLILSLLKDHRLYSLAFLIYRDHHTQLLPEYHLRPHHRTLLKRLSNLNLSITSLD